MATTADLQTIGIPDPHKAIGIFLNTKGTNPYSTLDTLNTGDGRIALIIDDGHERAAFGYYRNHTEALQALGQRLDRYIRLRPAANHLKNLSLQSGGFGILPPAQQARFDYFYSQWP